MRLVIIGGGPGGYVAAIRAAQLGATVTLIEKEQLGGTCLNRGCIPTKALYQNAQVIKTLQRSCEFGVTHGGFAIDMEAIQSRKGNVTAKLCAGIEQLMKSNGIECVRGAASFATPQRIHVVTEHGEREIDADKVIVATGSLPAMPPIEGVHLPGVFTSDELLNTREIPKSMVVIGGGVIGMELAGIFHAFGTDITVVEFLPRILNEVDRDLVARLTQVLRKGGMKFSTDTRVSEIRQTEEGSLEVLAEDKRGQLRFEAGAVLVATGRGINVSGLNLEGIGVVFDKRGVKVDENYQTNVEGVYAIGDVIGGLMLAHVASEEGRVCVERMMGLSSHLDRDAVPAVVFTDPEIASVGLTEEAAMSRSIPILSGRFMLGANAKAVTQGEEFGLVKVVAEAETKRIVGVHMLVAEASTVIHEGALAVSNKLTIEDIAHTVHAHPTLSEAFYEAVLDAENKAIHGAPKRK